MLDMAEVKCFPEKETGTAQYVVWCTETKKCAIIDSVLDFNPASGVCTTTSADILLSFIQEQSLTLEWILETHVHADHLTAAAYLKKKHPEAKVAIGTHVKAVQQKFVELLNLTPDHIEGDFFDHHWHDGDTFKIGNLEVRVIHTPGHTPADVTYYIPAIPGIFTGDSIFMPDMGTARCDFPGGSAETLWSSLQTLLGLDDQVRVYVGHDYSPGGRDFAWESTIEEQKQLNKHCKDGTAAEEFIRMRKERDSTLGVPRLLHASLQFNLRGGHPPPVESDGKSYIKTPITAAF